MYVQLWWKRIQNNLSRKIIITQLLLMVIKKTFKNKNLETYIYCYGWHVVFQYFFFVMSAIKVM